MKIKQIRSIGVQKTYSPQMKAPHHNYQTAESDVIHANSHAVSYCLWAYKCLWLKAHYPEEWWACVMSRCDQKKLPRYMSASRSEGVRFGEIDINHMTVNMTAHAGITVKDDGPAVSIGLISLKKVGNKIAQQFVDGNKHEYSDIDDFVNNNIKSKVLLERLIKLGSFAHIHSNIKATWMWYVHKYCAGEIKIPWEPIWDDSPFIRYPVPRKKTDHQGFVCDPDKFKVLNRKIKGESFEDKIYSPITVSRLKKYHRDCSLIVDGWTHDRILCERDRLLCEFKNNFPNRKKIPKKISEFVPTPNESRDRIMSFYVDDYDLKEILQFEYEFLGYYWHSPIDLYRVDEGTTIEHAKLTGYLNAIVIEKHVSKTKKGRPFIRLIVNDGIEDALVLIWEADICIQDQKVFNKDVGIRLKVEYDKHRNSFTLSRGFIIKSLWTKRGWDEYTEGIIPTSGVA